MNAGRIVVLGMMVLGMGAVSAHDRLSALSMAQKRAAQAYFRAHALGFSTYYGLYHPGPYWILQQKSLHLTSAQRRQETALKDGMARTTLQDNRRLQKAYALYGRLSQESHPDIARLERAIHAVGDDTARLAVEMIPYHHKAYRRLSPAQQRIYATLVAARVRQALAHHTRNP